MTRAWVVVALLWTLVGLPSLQAAECPPETQPSIYYCDDPDFIMRDPTVQCDPLTCRWEIRALAPNRPPFTCQSIRLVERELDNLPDYLEPCLWWSMLYGRLQYMRPSWFPSASPTDAPSNAPVDAVSGEPSGEPSMAPSRSFMPTMPLPTNAPSSKPTTAVTDTPSASPTASLTLRPTSTPTAAAVEEMLEPPVPYIPIALETVLLTFVRNHNNRHLQAVPNSWLLSTPQSLQALIEATSQHLLRSVPHLAETKLDLTRVETDLASPVAETLALTGTLYFNIVDDQEELPDLRPAVVRRQVQQAFQQADSVNAYVQALQATGQAPLTDLQHVYTGLIVPGDDVSSANTNQDSSQTKDDSSLLWQWDDPIWLAIVIGAGAALLGIICLVSVLCCRRRRRQRGIVPPNHINRQDSNLKVSRTASTEIRTNGLGNSKSHGDVENNNHEENEQDNAYADSEVTSVYSYIEHGSIMMDDQSYSVAPSYMYPNAAYGEEPYDPNKSWSVVDGLEPPAWRQQQQTPDGGPQTSPSRMVVTTTTQEKSTSSDAILQIFSDSDDDETSQLSAVSDRVVGPVALTYGHYGGPPIAHNLSRVEEASTCTTEASVTPDEKTDNMRDSSATTNIQALSPRHQVQDASHIRVGGVLLRKGGSRKDDSQDENASP